MNKIISSINEKGGTGKTTSVLGITAKLKKEGKKVLLIDLDYQMNLTTSMINDISVKTIFDLLTGTAHISECIQEGEIDIIPGDVRMRNLDKNIEEEIFKEIRMKNALECISEKYDYTMIDCRPWHENSRD